MVLRNTPEESLFSTNRSLEVCNRRMKHLQDDWRRRTEDVIFCIATTVSGELIEGAQDIDEVQYK